MSHPRQMAEREDSYFDNESSRPNATPYHPTEIDVIPRQDFVNEFGKNYNPGQHVTMLGPTQRGKTYLGLQLLGKSTSPEHKAVVLAGKPPSRDRGMEDAGQRLNMREIEQWPPGYSYNDRRRNGYILRPLRKVNKEPGRDNAVVANEFQRAMRDNYASKKPVITFVDEAHLVQNDLKVPAGDGTKRMRSLRPEFEAPLMRGAPVNAQWCLIQRGRFMSYLCYDAPEHIFIFYDPDKSNVRRYSEFGGVDPKYVQYIVEGLNTKETKNGMTISECLYIRRSGPSLAIVSYD